MCRIFIPCALLVGTKVNNNTRFALDVSSGQSCAEDKIRKCISIAEPMLKDPHLIFPDNMNDINNVCRTWSNFVDCIHRYIDKCFSKIRKDQFNSAVEPPIASVHQMCSISSYQAEYLQYAGCIKSTVIEPEHCGGHYSVLVAEVSQESVRKPNLCCAYHNFRTCVIQKTRLRCDGNQAEGIAAKFSRQVLDKAFRFLQDQCLNHISSPDTVKCSSMLSTKASTLSISRLGEGRSVSSSSSSNGGNGFDSISNRGPISMRKPTLSGDLAYRDAASKAAKDDYSDPASKPILQPSLLYEAGAAEPGAPSYTASLDNGHTRSTSSLQAPVTSEAGTLHKSGILQQAARQTGKSERKVNDEVRSDEGTSRNGEATHYTLPAIVENSGSMLPSTQRSLSYGRGISWTIPSTFATPSTSEIPDWATNTWLTHSQVFTTEEIYPAAGSFGGNNIDEPNQQGLSRNGQPMLLATILYIYIFCMYAFFINY